MIVYLLLAYGEKPTTKNGILNHEAARGQMRPSRSEIGRTAPGCAIEAALGDAAHELPELEDQDRRLDDEQRRQRQQHIEQCEFRDEAAQLRSEDGHRV